MGCHLLPVAYSFRIPSLHDDTPLDCRIHHPESLVNVDICDSSPRWTRKAAVLAHPYAALGGGFDDPILENVGAELLAQGYVVGTFNFRHAAMALFSRGEGAHNSSGRTSWTGKPELADYVSFAGALVCYIHALKLPSPSSTSDSKTPDEDETPIRIVFGGYSYGSLIVTRLPPVETLLAPFQSGPASHAAKVIHELASSLAARTTDELREQREKLKKQQNRLSPKSPRSLEIRRKSPVTVGGYDSDPAGKQRRSQDAGGRRSLNLDLRRAQSWGKELRNSLHAQRHHHGQQHEEVHVAAVDDGGDPSHYAGATSPPPPPPIPPLLPVRLAISPAYLLISPLLPPLSFLIAPSLALPSIPLPFLSFLPSSPASAHKNPLTTHPSLIAFGSHDGFTGSKRLRAWCSKLAAEADAQTTTSASPPPIPTVTPPARLITWREVEGAGHFWLEPGAMRELRGLVRTWAKQLPG